MALTPSSQQSVTIRIAYSCSCGDIITTYLPYVLYNFGTHIVGMEQCFLLALNNHRFAQALFPYALYTAIKSPHEDGRRDAVTRHIEILLTDASVDDSAVRLLLESLNFFRQMTVRAWKTNDKDVASGKCVGVDHSQSLVVEIDFLLAAKAAIRCQVYY